jgi:hypothetical protein
VPRNRNATGALFVLTTCLVGVIVGLIILGKHQDAVQDSITGLATIGAGLTGGFAGWFARDRAEQLDDDDRRRRRHDAS